VQEYAIVCRAQGARSGLTFVRHLDSEDDARVEAQVVMRLYGYGDCELWRGEQLLQHFSATREVNGR
jgi:hypothetical protein